MSVTAFLLDSLSVFVLLIVCSLGPGLFFVRRLRWPPAETFCVSVAASLLLLALGSMAIFWLTPGHIPAMHWGLSVICLALDLACLSDLRRLLANNQVRRTLRLFALAWVWSALLLCLIRNYSGGNWWGDWYEQYLRSDFFVSHPSPDVLFLGHYRVVDRPPLMNLICAHYLAQVGLRFVPYEWVAAFLNLLPILPCALFAVSVAARNHDTRRAVWPALLLILIASPMFMQNVTFVWTKSFAAFFALLGLWFYLRGWMKRDSRRIVAGFLLLTAAGLVHMYAIAALVIITFHYLLIIWPRRPNRLAELAAIALSCAGLILTCLGSSIQTYGLNTAFSANLTEPYPGLTNLTLLSRVRVNVISTIVPYFLRSPPYAGLQQSNPLGWFRDLSFNLYQTNAIFILGSVGAATLLYALINAGTVADVAPGKRLRRDLRRFWITFPIASIALGLCMVPMPEPWGAAHLSMLPQALLGLAVLAAMAARLPRPWQTLLLVGCTIDFLIGVLLQVHLESLTLDTGVPNPGHAALANYVLQHEMHVVMIGDALGSGAVVIQIALCLLFALFLTGMAKAIRQARTG